MALVSEDPRFDGLAVLADQAEAEECGGCSPSPVGSHLGNDRADGLDPGVAVR